MARKNHNVEKDSVGVYRDHNSKTCLLVKDGEQVEFIPLDISRGFEVHTTTRASFDARYKAMPDYPIDRAAALYFNYARTVGATKDALAHLSKLTDISRQEKRQIIKIQEGRSS